ncbi:MAG: sulfatase [Porticoccaceae bacterium]|nr:sulfatase [Porticoccaceae bacterium]
MKRLLVSLLVVLVGASIAWLKRDDILLAVIKYQSANEYDVAENRTIPWQQGPAEAVTREGEQPPNIILIVADDLGFNDISTFGGGVAGGKVKTPSIDRLAAEGAVFNQSYSGASTCAPSRAMMMTGRYPTRTGFEFTPTPSGMGKVVARLTDSLDNNMPPSFYNEALEAGQPPYEQKGLPASEVTIAEMLKAQGYYTAHVGKWHLGRDNGMAPHQQGFDDSLLMASGLYLPEDDPNVVNAKLPFDAIDKFLWARMVYAASYNSGDQDRFKPGGYLTDYWTDESIKIIKANKNRPFFLYLAHWGTHTPLQATREDYEAVGDIKPHRKRVYAAMIRALDRSVRRILDTLEAEGLSDNTIVAFTSDNGGPGYIGIPDVNTPFRGWKITMFEGGIRVPMFVKWPAKITAGTKVDTPVAHIDMMPTLANAAGAQMPEGVEIDGVDMLPLATGEGIEDWNRETLFWQNDHYQVVRHGDWKLQVNDRPTDGLQKWLYNLAEDPTEQNNLAASRTDKVEELDALLAAHQASSRGPLYAPTTQMPLMIDKTMAEKFEDGDEYIYTPN